MLSRLLLLVLAIQLPIFANDEIYLEKGFYPEELSGANFIDSEKKAKVIFNLPPYVNPGGIGILPEMLKLISSARISIRMSFFQFNHKEVFQALKDAARRGVKIYITTDLCYSGKSGYKEYFEDLKVTLDSVGQSGASQVVDDGTASCDTMFNHNKYAVTDIEDGKKAAAWFGSFNPTNHGAVENVELALVVQDKKAAEILFLDFDQQYHGKFKVAKKGVYSIGIKGEKEKIEALEESEVKEILKNGGVVTYPRVVLGDVTIEFILNPKLKSLARIVEEIYQSEKEILFSSFAIGDQMLISSLINKSNTTGESYNLFSILSLPHPGDKDGVVSVSNGNTSKTLPLPEKDKVEKEKWMKPIVDEIKSTLSTPNNYITPKNELKGVYKYIYQKGPAGGAIKKVRVEGIFNSKVIGEKDTLQRLANFNIPVFKSSLNGELHNKIFIIDEKKVIFGSHNFSQAAENVNDELTAIVDSPRLGKLLKEHLFNKTKLFSVNVTNPVRNFSGQATLAFTEVRPISPHKMQFKGKERDPGQFVEIYNYGNRPINLMGLRIDDHYFPDKDGDILNHSSLAGYQGTLVRFIPAKKNGEIGKLVYDQDHNVLSAGKTALIVGKYFQESFYLQEFEEAFRGKFGRKPLPDEHPIFFTTSEYFSLFLGDSASGIKKSDRLSLLGLDGMTVVDRYTPLPTEEGKTISSLSVSRKLNSELLSTYEKMKRHKLIRKRYKLKNGDEFYDTVFDFERIPLNSSPEEWQESVDVLGTPGFVELIGKRSVASLKNLFSIEGEIADVENNLFKKGLVVIENNKILDIVYEGVDVNNSKKYPAPILKNVLIFPGLIDTHNHIKYNTMPIWKTSKIYNNRSEWPKENVYTKGVKELFRGVYTDWSECKQTDESEQLKCLARNRCKVIQYGEIKSLLGGTTSIQGSSSFDENTSDVTFKGLTPYYVGQTGKLTRSKARAVEDMLDTCTRGLARNIERELWHGVDEIRTTSQPINSDAFALASLSDEKKIKNTPTYKLLQEFQNNSTRTFFVHLGEGKDQFSKDEWKSLVDLKLARSETTIIHGTAFSAEEFMQMSKNGQSLSWSPTSNLLLYKKTTDIPLAIENNVNVALGSDWSLSGTKSLLYELKTADKVNKKYFSSKLRDIDLLKMVTVNAAKAAHLYDLIGSISKGKLADMVIVEDNFRADSPFKTLIKLAEKDIHSVWVDGHPATGKEKSLRALMKDLEEVEDNLAVVSDNSCGEMLAVAIPHAEYTSLVSVLNKKTAEAFSMLPEKLKSSLGNEFSFLDPLCSHRDDRARSLIDAL